MRSEAHNTDCIEFMRSLPDKCFSLAVCDPPYGKGNDESLVGGGVRFGQRFDKYFKPSGGKNHSPAHIETLRGMVQTLRQAAGTDSVEDAGNATTHRFSRGTRETRYRGGVNPKPRNGMSPLRRSSSMNFSVLAKIKSFGEAIISHYHRHDASSCGERKILHRISAWQCVNTPGHRSQGMRRYLNLLHNVERTAESSTQRRSHKNCTAGFTEIM